MSGQRIIYSRGFPYGAPLAMLRGGATRDAATKDYIKSEGFRWNGSSHAWEAYLDRRDLTPVLRRLRDDFGHEVVPKADMSESYLIDLDTGDRP